MAEIHLDKVVMSSFHESFRNRESLSAGIEIPATSIPAFGSKGWEATIPFKQEGAVSRVYYERSGGTYRYKAESSFVLQEFQGSGGASISLRNEVPNQLIVTISVSNVTASPINTTAQTYNIYVRVFDTSFVV